jgi:hypothetical protein
MSADSFGHEGVTYMLFENDGAIKLKIGRNNDYGPKGEYEQERCKVYWRDSDAQQSHEAHKLLPDKLKKNPIIITQFLAQDYYRQTKEEEDERAKRKAERHADKEAKNLKLKELQEKQAKRQAQR